MSEEKTKKILLFLLIAITLGGLGWAIISLTYSPIKELRSNTTNESNAYKDASNDNNTASNSNNSVIEDNNYSTSSISSNVPIETKISEYTTTIYDTEESRIHNITLAVNKLDNTYVNSGAEFSFNETIGPMGEKQGYQKATGFDGNGNKIKIYGGGMCQISSTLYNAVLIANLEVVERHAHSRRVYYVPQDKDASVSYGGADFKFKNTSDKKLKISATTDGHNVTIILYSVE